MALQTALTVPPSSSYFPSAYKSFRAPATCRLKPGYFKGRFWCELARAQSR